MRHSSSYQSVFGESVQTMHVPTYTSHAGRVESRARAAYAPSRAEAIPLQVPHDHVLREQRVARQGPPIPPGDHDAIGLHTRAHVAVHLLEVLEHIWLCTWHTRARASGMGHPAFGRVGAL